MFRIVGPIGAYLLIIVSLHFISAPRLFAEATEALVPWGQDFDRLSEGDDLRAQGLDFVSVKGVFALDRAGSLRNAGSLRGVDMHRDYLTGNHQYPRIDKEVIQIAGTYHGVALTRDGSVYVWGGVVRTGTKDRHTGEIEWKHNYDDQRLQPPQFPAEANITHIAAGWRFTVALDDIGHLYFWGPTDIFTRGTYGLCMVTPSPMEKMQLEHRGEETIVQSPVHAGLDVFKVPLLEDGTPIIKTLEAGGLFAVTLRHDGKIDVWGMTDQARAILSDYREAVKDREEHGTGLVITAIAAGDGFVVALNEDGQVFEWGSDGKSHSKPMPEGLNDIVAVSAQAYNRLVLRSDGTVVAWGRFRRGGFRDEDGNKGYDPGSFDPPAELVGVVRIQADANASYAWVNADQ